MNNASANRPAPKRLRSIRRGAATAGLLFAFAGCESSGGGGVVETPEYYNPYTFGLESGNPDRDSAGRPTHPIARPPVPPAAAPRGGGYRR
ncbi:MAG TPA: hypothetical protein VG796_13725 [Verrucomicrobiales bacterium]|nr:hypothetical protein [Verrucomicrobiales bacterium]